MKRLSADQGNRFAQFRERFQLVPFRGSQQTVVVAVHERLKKRIGLCREPHRGERFHESQWGFNDSRHSTPPSPTVTWLLWNTRELFRHHSPRQFLPAQTR